MCILLLFLSEVIDIAMFRSHAWSVLSVSDSATWSVSFTAGCSSGQCCAERLNWLFHHVLLSLGCLSVSLTETDLNVRTGQIIPLIRVK